MKLNFDAGNFEFRNGPTPAPLFRLAIIGDGTTAVNALDAAVELIATKAGDGPRIDITVIGKADEQNVGKGFAYGPVGSRTGHLTEPASAGHADYTAVKGAFTDFQRNKADVTDSTLATRALIGDFHVERFEQVQQRARDLGIKINYIQAEALDIERNNSQYQVVTKSGQSVAADHIVLAVGDVLSRRFNAAAKQFAGEVFETPYHALDTILSNHTAETTVLALGTRSSFVDLANGLHKEGFAGRVIGVSSTGITSWPTTPDPEALYTPRHLNAEKGYKNLRQVLNDLAQELTTAQNEGAYVPESLLQNVTEQAEREVPKRLRWNFDPQAERDYAGKPTYHQIAQAVNWEKIYEGLSSRYEQRLFQETLGDFALYNRVNRIVAADFNAFADHQKSGAVQIERASFESRNIARNFDGRLSVALDNSKTIDCDYVVNCAIGPSSALEQVKHHDLLANLAKRHILTPQAAGTGFSLHKEVENFDVLGAQARLYCFSGIGIETYGRQITNTFIPHLQAHLEQFNTQPQPTIQRPITLKQEIKYG